MFYRIKTQNKNLRYFRDRRTVDNTITWYIFASWLWRKVKRQISYSKQSFDAI